MPRRERAAWQELRGLLSEAPLLTAQGCVGFLGQLVSEGGEGASAALAAARDIILTRPLLRQHTLGLVLDAAYGACGFVASSHCAMHVPAMCVPETGCRVHLRCALHVLGHVSDRQGVNQPTNKQLHPLAVLFRRWMAPGAIRNTNKQMSKQMNSRLTCCLRADVDGSTRNKAVRLCCNQLVTVLGGALAPAIRAAATDALAALGQPPPADVAPDEDGQPSPTEWSTPEATRYGCVVRMLLCCGACCMTSCKW
jgi:hypothetical protein